MIGDRSNRDIPLGTGHWSTGNEPLGTGQMGQMVKFRLGTGRILGHWGQVTGQPPTSPWGAGQMVKFRWGQVEYWAVETSKAATGIERKDVARQLQLEVSDNYNSRSCGRL
jgi:hypothetical protein